MWLFLNALIAYAMLLADLYTQIDNTVHLRIYWAKNEFHLIAFIIHTYVTIRSIFEEVRSINHTKLCLFLDALLAYALLLGDLYTQIDNTAYLRIYWAKNEFRHWTQFFNKEVDLRPTF